jgi:hypothetical protein
MLVWVWDGKKEDTRRQCCTVDVIGWAKLGYVLCKEDYQQLPPDVQKYLETQVIEGRAVAEK